jgi:CheY-like chemotaxis protein
MAGPNPTILLIEDEFLIRMSTAAILEDEGYAVLEAGSADEAQSLLTAHPEIGIVVTDVQMPGSMDGFDLVALLHRDHPHIRILVTSGRSGLQHRQSGGQISFLSKPYTAPALQKALSAFTAA